MSKFYTSVVQRGNALYVRGIDRGQRFNEKVDFHPTIWTNSKSSSASDPWTTLDGQTVYSLRPGSIQDTKQYIDQYNDVHGMNIYESPGHVYQYITENYPGEVQWSMDNVVVYTLDIETSVDAGFPNPQLANEQITLISVKDAQSNVVHTWGYKPINAKLDNVEYKSFTSEQSMLKDFLAWWMCRYPDVVSGWMSSLFDVTYIYNRMVKVLGESMAKKLSPWGHVTQREVEFGNRTSTKTIISGIADMDYLDLYKKFGTYSAKESYRLDFIANDELGTGKLENPTGTDSFRAFYTGEFDIHTEPPTTAHKIHKLGWIRSQLKSQLESRGQQPDQTPDYIEVDTKIKQLCWDEFVRYNVIDVRLVDQLDAKLKLMSLALTIAYSAKVNYADVFSPVKVWDVIIYNYLNNQRIVIPRMVRRDDVQQIEGAYVKDPLVGRHNSLISFDYDSLYPHLIMMYNISPETITDLRLDVSVDRLLNQQCDLSEAYDLDLCVAANGWTFRRDKKGILPTMMQLYYDKRVEYKKQMLKSKQVLADIKAELKSRGVEV